MIFFSLSYYICSTAQRTDFSWYLHGDHWWGDLRASSDAARCVPVGGCYFHPLLWCAWRTCGWWLYLNQIEPTWWKIKNWTQFTYSFLSSSKFIGTKRTMGKACFIFRKAVVISKNFSRVPFFSDKLVRLSQGCFFLCPYLLNIPVSKCM